MTSRILTVAGSGLVTVVLVALSVPIASAQAVHVTDDTNINLASASQVNGAATTLLVRNVGSGGERHTFVRFNGATLPTGQIVTKATLRLFVTAVNDPGRIDVYSVAGPWTEETLSAAVAPARGPLVGTITVTAADANRFVVLDVTSVVQAWLAGTLANGGLALVPSTVDPVRVTLDSKESIDTSQPPELEVALISPADITAVNAGLGLTGGGTAGDVTVALDTPFTDARYAASTHGHTVGQVSGAATLGANLFSGDQGVFGRVSANQSAVPSSVVGQHSAATGQSIGVLGISNSTSGTGVFANAPASSGSTKALQATVSSATGVAALLENQAGGDLIRGTGVNSALSFRVDGVGAVYAGSYRDLAGNPIASGTGDITAVAATVGLTGGGGTGDVSLGLDTAFTDGRYAGLAHGHDVGQVANAARLGANLFSGTQTIDGANLDLDPSTAGAGTIAKNGVRFLHNAGTDNVFVGLESGTFSTQANGNTAVGARAMRDNANGAHNTAVGMNALFKNWSGQGNTASGANALANNTTGGANTAVGHGALGNNTIGAVNTASGAGALSANTVGDGNAAFGSAAMSSNTSGRRNTAIGGGASGQNTTGTRNVAAGYESLASNVTGDGNVAQGANALLYATGSNNVAVGDAAGLNATSGSNNIYLGANVQGVAGESNAMYLGGTQTAAYIAGVRGTAVTGGEVVMVDAAGRLGSGAAAVGGDSVGSAQVIDESLTSADLGPGSVSGSELVAGAVTADKVAFSYAGSAAPGGPALDVACVGCIAATEVGFGFAGAGANTFTGTQTIDAGNIDLDASTATAGSITKSGTLFLHNFGVGNTFLGFGAGNVATTGDSNTGIGFNALLDVTSGFGNSAVGVAALRRTTTGARNTAVGQSSLRDNTDGTLNTATGVNSLLQNATGQGNTAAGFGALLGNVAGNFNSALGMNALLNATGSDNVALGRNAGTDATAGSNNIYLGSEVVGVAGESNTMYLGKQGTQTATYIAGIRGTTVTGGQAVLVDAAGRLGSGTAAVGGDSVGSTQVIDESLSAADLGPGSVAGSELAAGAVTADKVAFGYAGSSAPGGAALDVTCVGCIAASEVAFGFAGAGANTFTGTQTIDGGNLDLDGSTAAGGNVTKNGASFLHNTGTANTFLGVTAGNSGLTGANNTAIGHQALNGLTSATGNTAVGNQALALTTTGPGNTAVGGSALVSNTTGNGNTAVGGAALASNTVGIQNLALGGNALSQSTGNRNIGIGQSAGTNLTSGSNNIYLGSLQFGTASESNTMYLGGTQTKALIAGVRGITTVSPDAIPVVIDSTGQLGTVSSSRRFKEDIHDMADTSRRLLQLRPVTFRYTQPFGDGSKPVQFGLVAEEVAEAFPELAVRDAKGEVETVHYETLNVLLLNELQRMHGEMAEQRERLRTLERLVNDLAATRVANVAPR